MRSTLLLFVAVLVLAASACHDEGDIRVAALVFEGNRAFADKRLSAVLATHKSGWLPWSTRQYFDRAEFKADLARLKTFYTDRGYPHARVSSVDVALSDDRKSVKLRIVLDEGRPVLVERVTFVGFDAVPVEVLNGLRALAVTPGQPADRERIAAARAGAVHLLRENGYAQGKVDFAQRPGADPDHVIIEFGAVPGTKTYFGPVAVTGLKSVDERVVQRSMAYSPGDLYRESLVLKSQRQLSSLEVFDFANVHTGALPAQQAGRLPTTVTVTEGAPQRIEMGAGYGTDDRLRGSIQWRHVNVFGRADQLSATGKWARTIQGASFGYARPHLFAAASSFDVRGSAWWSNAPSYTSQSYGGRATLTYLFDVNDAPHKQDDRNLEVRFAFGHEYLRYAIRDEALADLSGFEERIALGLDPVTGRGSGTLAAVSVSIKRTVVDDAANPGRGHSLSLQLEHAAPWLGGTFRYNEVEAEARAYGTLGELVLAGRVSFGTLAARNPVTVPFSARYFLGGSGTLRGWGRFEVAPLTTSGLPLGGRTSLAFSTEVRFPIRGVVGGALFLDAGNVWAGDWEVHRGGLRYAAGPGVRVATPFGIVRADVGFQLNPIAGLRINGKPEAHHWRIQFSVGQAF